MKKMNLLITITTTIFYSCIATDLSDLDSLYINTKEGLKVSPVETVQNPETTTTAQTTAAQTTTETNTNDDSESCELLFCGNLSSLKNVLSVGNTVEFGYDFAKIEGFYYLDNQEVWRSWYNEQYGIVDEVSLVRYIVDGKKNGKTLVIETFYNRDEGEFLFARVLYQGEYAQDDMQNFILKIEYTNARNDFDPEKAFWDNHRSTYFSNADNLLKTLTNYISEL